MCWGSGRVLNLSMQEVLGEPWLVWDLGGLGSLGV